MHSVFSCRWRDRPFTPRHAGRLVVVPDDVLRPIDIGRPSRECLTRNRRYSLDRYDSIRVHDIRMHRNRHESPGIQIEATPRPCVDMQSTETAGFSKWAGRRVRCLYSTPSCEEGSTPVCILKRALRREERSIAVKTVRAANRRESENLRFCTPRTSSSSL